MPTTASICAEIDNCCNPSESKYRQWSLQLLCNIASTQEDYELVCASTDGRLLRYDAETFALTELDGSAIGDGATAVPCGSEFGQIRNTGAGAADIGVMGLAVRNPNKNSLTTANDVYSPIGVGPAGEVMSSPVVFGTTVAENGRSPVRLEDDGFAANNAVMVAGCQRQDTPTADTGTDGDIQPFKANQYGQLYVQTAAYAFASQHISVAFGAITNAFVSTGAISGQPRMIKIMNHTDAAIEISTDATNVWDYMAPGEVMVWDLAANGRLHGSAISIRYVGAAPTAGAFKVTYVR